MNRYAMEKLLNATFECDHSNQKMTHYSNLTWEQTCEECGEIIKSGTYEKSERGQILTSTPQDEPVAMRYDFDGYGYKYIDSGSGSDWRTRIKDAEPVFDRPQQRKPLTADQVWSLVYAEGYVQAEETADFINGIRHGEAAHGIGCATTPVKE